MWELDHEESWVLKNWCFWTVVLEKTLESPLDCKEFQPVHPKGDQSWIFIGRTGAEAETPVLWPPDVKSWLVGKDSDAGKDWGQEEKGMTEDKTVACITDLMGMSLSKLQGMVMERKAWRAAVNGVADPDMSEQLNWTDWEKLTVQTLFKMNWIREKKLRIEDFWQYRNKQLSWTKMVRGTMKKSGPVWMNQNTEPSTLIQKVLG